MRLALFLTSLLPSLLFSATSIDQLRQQAHQQGDLAQQKARALFSVTGNAPMTRLDADDRFHLSHLDALGKPVWEELNNRHAAEIINVEGVWPGGYTNIDENGSGIDFLAIWDGGGVRTSHQEFNGRVQQMDSAPSYNFHATHVAGSMIASGVNPESKGMAPAAGLKAWDWQEDETEILDAAWTGEILSSNHSYGNSAGFSSSGGEWYWHGDPEIDAQEDWVFGYYGTESQFLDEVARFMPNYLMVRSAGNHRTEIGPVEGDSHWIYDNGLWVESFETRHPDGGLDGFDSLNPRAAAKNPLIVGSIEDMPNGYEGPESVNLSLFSSHGPTDDGRIKPELVANGRTLTSSLDTADDAYATYSGTSMSTPTVTGTVALLQKLFIEGHPDSESPRGGRVPLSSSIRAALIQTAREAGPENGPDYRMGYGLVNASEAALLIQDECDTRRRLLENELSNGEVDSLYFKCDGGAARFTLAWTDRHAQARPVALNDATPLLVNDLDLRLINVDSGQSWLAWGLDPQNPEASAQPIGNHLDNVELLEAFIPPGSYIVLVDHSASLADRQTYSLTWSGMEAQANLETSAGTTTPVLNEIISLPVSLNGAMGLAGLDLNMSWSASAFEFVSFDEGDALAEGASLQTTTLYTGTDSLSLRFDRLNDERGLDLPSGLLGTLSLRCIAVEASDVTMDAHILSAAGEDAHLLQGCEILFNEGALPDPVSLLLDLDDVQLHLGEAFSPLITVESQASLRALFVQIDHGPELELVSAENLSSFEDFTVQIGSSSTVLIWNHSSVLNCSAGSPLAQLEIRLVDSSDSNLSLQSGTAVHENNQPSEIIGDSLQTWFMPHLPSGGTLILPADGDAVIGPVIHVDWGGARDPHLGGAIGYSVVIGRRPDLVDADTLLSVGSSLVVELDPGMYWWTVLSHFEFGVPVMAKKISRFFVGLSDKDGGLDRTEGSDKSQLTDLEKYAQETSMDDTGEMLPETTRLADPYPNPFNPAVRIPVELAQSGHVNLAVYDLLGRRVALLLDETLPAGRRDVQFQAGNQFASGIYLVVLQTADKRDIRKIQLLR